MYKITSVGLWGLESLASPMILGLVVFLFGTRTYRYSVKRDNKNAFVRTGRVFFTAFRNGHTSSSAIATKGESRGAMPRESYEQFK